MIVKDIKSKLNSQSLNLKLNISIITCVILVFSGLIYLITKHSKPIIETQIENIAHKYVESYVFDFTHLLRDTEQILLHTKNALSQTSEKRTSSIPILLNSSIQTVYHSELIFLSTWIYIFSPENKETGTLYKSEHIKGEEADYSSEKIENISKKFTWLKDIPEENKIFWSEPYLDKNGNKVITCVIPFRFLDSSEVDGLVGFTVDLVNIQNSIKGLSFYEEGDVLLISKSGLYVSHPDPDIAFKMTTFDLAKKMNDPNLVNIGNKIISGKSGKIILPYSTMFDSPVIIFYSPIKHINWGVGIVYNKDKFLFPLYQFQLLVIISSLISIILISLIINWVCRRSTKQITKLNEIASQYTSGDFSNSFDEKPSSKDIEILSKTLSKMKVNILGYTKRETQNAIEKQKNQSELEIAHDIQLASMSTKYPIHEAFEIYSKLIPAKHVGGDFYDFFFIDENKFAIVIADVSGKGIPASLYMMKSQTLIRNIIKSQVNLKDVLFRLNNELCEGNDTYMFVTAFIGIIDLTTGDMQYVNAGHVPPLLKNNNKYDYLISNKNVVMGIYKNTEYQVETIKLFSGNSILLYTDGVTEAENSKASFYGEKRLRDILNDTQSDPKHNLQIVLKDIKKFSKNAAQSDDIAMLEFAYKGKNRNTYIIYADVKNLSEFLEFMERDIEYKKLSDDVKFKSVMVAEEIFSNICQHAYKNPKNAKITIETEVVNGVYYITFIDKGKEYNLIEHKNPDFSKDIKNRDIGGLGVYLIKKMSDKIYYTRKRKQNILRVGIIIK